MTWTPQPLGSALRHRKELVTIDDLTEYRRCHVQVGGRGVVLRDAVQGTDIRTKQQQVCRAGDFLVAEIDAKMGGFGMVPPALAGAVVSSHYFLFELDQTRIVPEYLDYLCGTSQGERLDELRGREAAPCAVVEGTGPPLAQQRRVVARLDLLLSRLSESQRLGAEVANDLSALRGALIQEAYDALAHAVGSTTISEFCTSITDGTHVAPTFSEEAETLTKTSPGSAPWRC